MSPFLDWFAGAIGNNGRNRMLRQSQTAAPRIDVHELVERLSHEELLSAADQYFAGLSLESEQCWKPFSNPTDAVHLHRNLALVLQAADLFRGAQVLDFGCGTGWLTLSVANLGCAALGVDVAPRAIALAEQWAGRHALRSGAAVSFRPYDGRRLPLEDESVDRILCFDSFHHVADQAATLQEFARVLRPGGRISMLEPGPNHSRTAQSQMEMTRYKVIENDIDMNKVRLHAVAAGLSAPNMLVQLPAPLELPVEKYLEWSAAGEMPTAPAQFVSRELTHRLTDTQCFFIAKPGTGLADSRDPKALAAELRLLSAVPSPDVGGRWRFQVRVKNIGEGKWLAGGRQPGQVQLGVQLLDPAGSLVNLDFFRVTIGKEDLGPGQSRVIEFDISLDQTPRNALRFDLVSELVSWFAEQGRTQPIHWGGLPL